MIDLIKNDLYRYSESVSLKSFFKMYFLSPGFHVTFWFRLSSQFNNLIIRYILRNKTIYYGIELHPNTKIGKGFYIGHHGTIVINPKSIIGNNCNISQGVTIGQINSGKNKGTPKIGDNVYIGPGAKIIGNIIIGNNVVIGANSVVNKSFPENVTIGGVPAKIISNNNSEKYINRVYL